MYEVGTIKLTWIDPKDFTILESSMFNTIEDALENVGDRKDWMIFKLEDVEGDSYKWKLQPYGSYKSFVNGMKFRNSGFYGITMFALVGLSIYGLYKIFK
jgi:hypothetical protein